MITQHWLAGYKETTSILVQLVQSCTVHSLQAYTCTGSFTIPYRACDQINKPACFVNVLPCFREVLTYSMSFILLNSDFNINN